MKLFLKLILLISFSISTYGDIEPKEPDLVQILIDVKGKGEGNLSAGEAWLKISSLPPSSIPNLLNAMNHANPIGDNWIRSAIEKISENSESSLPVKKILQFLEDKSNSGEAREQAFQVLQSSNKDHAKKLIPTFLKDPTISLRRKAVSQLLLNASKETDQSKKIKLYEKALENGRDVDQIKSASDALEKTGKKVNIQERMGFLVNWHTVGPFNNEERKGFDLEYKPESRVDFAEKYKGKNGLIKWSQMSSNDPFGLVDINQNYGQLKEVLAYAYTEFNSKNEQKAQFRIGSKNAWKLWVNGELLFARDEYHRGKTRVDQFVIVGELKKGENQILVKVCQNEQTQSWTKQWEFCLRITDKTGTPIHENKKLSYNF